MQFPKECIIFGGGASISEGLQKGLLKEIENKFVIGCNYSYNHYIPTFTSFVDKTFYETNIDTLKDLPLIIGQGKKVKSHLANSIFIPCRGDYKRDISGGVYTAKLSGMYALTLAIYYLGRGTIYLLGYDFGAINKQVGQHKVPLTHYYQDKGIKHRGIGKISWYTKPDRDIKEWKCYEDLEGIKIYNVSMNSNLRTFPKITYKQFFSMISKDTYNQDALRQSIISTAKQLPNAQFSQEFK